MLERSRAAILPTPGDPYINNLWLSSYKKLWSSEIDKLYICLNSGLDNVVLNWVAEQYTKLGCHVIVKNTYLNHGRAIRECLETCTEQYVLLLEDDFYILRSGQVDRLFKVVESGKADAVASLRASCGQELHKQLVKRFNLVGAESLEPNFWPCLFLSDKKHLLNTSQWFDSYNFTEGKYYKELDWTPPSMESGDTFVRTSIELRGMGLKFHLEPQHRNTTNDLFSYPQGRGMFTQNLPWTHFGSSSTSLNGSLLDENDCSLGNKHAGKKCSSPVIQDEHIREDYERRVALWKLCFDRFPIAKEKNTPTYFNDIYSKALNKLIDSCNLNREKIGTFQSIYKNVLGVIL